MTETPRAAAVILAAGSGTRVGAGTNKVLLTVAGLPLLVHSVLTALEVEGVHRIVLVVRPEDRDLVTDAVTPHLGVHDVWIVDGGAERHDSEWQALRALATDIEGDELEVVVVHDAARPLATPALWREVIDAAASHGGAIPVVPAGRLSRRDGSLALRPSSGDDRLVVVQTPQAFAAEELLTAYRCANRDGFVGTDTAACLERYADPERVRVVGVTSDPANLKVTFAEDVPLAEELLSSRR